MEETLVIVDAFCYGLGLPLSPFMSKLLEFYGIALIHMSPDYFLVLFSFAHFCVAYIGTDPSLSLYRYLYYLGKPNHPYNFLDLVVALSGSR